MRDSEGFTPAARPKVTDESDKPKMGRPPLPKSKRKSETLKLHLTPGQIAAIRRAARRLGLAPSDFARGATLRHLAEIEANPPAEAP